MTENLTKLPVKSILRKSSLTFIEHDDSEVEITLETEKPTKVIVEPVQTPPKEYPGETEEEKARRQEFELKRKLNRAQEAMKVQIAKKLLSQEEGIEEEIDVPTEDETVSDASEDALENNREEDNDYYYASADDVTEDGESQNADMSAG
ncbi:uncharacterized protein LOC129232132 [Uloborus diversus]|uniref:uncharacterized protein LOC129232132 n=1 Tax=Uloborus diversus TaxID=327109 RepID=UPI0024099F15|nr:uncharacterized protein LOC129232132 [Uloborus diversus]